ncbi:hypothetical protein CYMTET_7909, partial [Cymbomonas tetramitiformis]
MFLLDALFSKQLGEGVAPKDIKVDMTLGALKIRQLYWTAECYHEFQGATAARTAGRAKTKIPTAFEAATQQKAVTMHRDGKLWPSGGAATIVFDGDEEEPDPSIADWAEEVSDHTDVSPGASTSASAENSHRNTFQDVGQAIVEAAAGRNKRRRAHAEDDDEEIIFEDVTVDTVAVTLATSKDEHAFKVK